MEGNRAELDAAVYSASEHLQKNAHLIAEAYDNGMYFEAANMISTIMAMLDSVGQAMAAMHVETYGEADLNQRILIERMKRNGSNN